MNKLLKLFMLGLLLVSFPILANAQKPKIQNNLAKTVAKTTFGIAKEATVIIVGQTTKIAWKTTKFAALEGGKTVAKDIAKPVLLKVTPQVSLFLLKQSGNVVQKGAPVAAKLLITYLKYKLPF
jgi:hypothetical protein